jgi:four helix bundle protein
MKVDGFRDLIAWQKAVELVVDCYKITKRFPPTERYGLTSQLQRAAVSVPANIAEGKGRGFNGAYVNHLAIANGSLCELETHIEIAKQLGYLEIDQSEQLQQKIGEVGRLITALRKSVEAAIR